MTQRAYSYARALYELALPEGIAELAEKMIRTSGKLRRALQNPLIPEREKKRVIERVFPEEIQNFMKYLCRSGAIFQCLEIFQAYREYSLKQKGVLGAVLYYVTPPDEEQLEGIRKFLQKREKVSKVEFSLVEKPELIGGFLLQAGDREYDWSLKGRMERLTQKLTRR